MSQHPFESSVSLQPDIFRKADGVRCMPKHKSVLVQKNIACMIGIHVQFPASSIDKCTLKHNGLTFKVELSHCAGDVYAKKVWRFAGSSGRMCHTAAVNEAAGADLGTWVPVPHTKDLGKEMSLYNLSCLCSAGPKSRFGD